VFETVGGQTRPPPPPTPPPALHLVIGCAYVIRRDSAKYIYVYIYIHIYIIYTHIYAYIHIYRFQRTRAPPPPSPTSEWFTSVLARGRHLVPPRKLIVVWGKG